MVPSLLGGGCVIGGHLMQRTSAVLMNCWLECGALGHIQSPHNGMSGVEIVLRSLVLW